MEIVLGSKVRDTVTGFTGIATSSHKYLNGCVRISVSPPVDKDGKMQEPQVFDVQQLEVLEGPVAVTHAEAPAAVARPGGDRPLTAPHR